MKPSLLPVLNALGVLDNPNRPLLPHLQPTSGDRRAMAYASSAQHVDARSLDDALASGLYAVNVTLGHVAGSDDARSATERDIAGWDAFIAAHPQLLKVGTGEDLAAARRDGRIGVIYGFQNTEMLGTDVAAVDHFADLGVRVIQLTYNGRNAVGCGATVPDDDGLSAFGAEVVERLQQRRVLVDLSHSSERTCLDTLRRARQPVAITHTGYRAIADHPRNKSDTEPAAACRAGRGGRVVLRALPADERAAACGRPHLASGACDRRLRRGSRGPGLRRRQHALRRHGRLPQAPRGRDRAAPQAWASARRARRRTWGRSCRTCAGRTSTNSWRGCCRRGDTRAARIEKILHGNFRRLMTRPGNDKNDEMPADRHACRDAGRAGCGLVCGALGAGRPRTTITSAIGRRRPPMLMPPRPRCLRRRCCRAKAQLSQVQIHGMTVGRQALSRQGDEVLIDYAFGERGRGDRTPRALDARCARPAAALRGRRQ